MLSFDLSAVDVVLLVAVFILFSLYVTKMKEKPKNQSKSKTEKPQISKKSQTTSNLDQKPERLEEKLQPGFDCTHHFGYLKNLSRNTPVPNECFGCPKVMQCLFPNE